jgi:hypothetical protein
MMESTNISAEGVTELLAELDNDVPFALVATAVNV